MPVHRLCSIGLRPQDTPNVSDTSRLKVKYLPSGHPLPENPLNGLLNYLPLLVPEHFEGTAHGLNEAVIDTARSQKIVRFASKTAKAKEVIESSKTKLETIKRKLVIDRATIDHSRFAADQKHVDTDISTDGKSEEKLELLIKYKDKAFFKDADQRVKAEQLIEEHLPSIQDTVKTALKEGHALEVALDRVHVLLSAAQAKGGFKNGGTWVLKLNRANLNDNFLVTIGCEYGPNEISVKQTMKKDERRYRQMAVDAHPQPS